jgi:hypothetical protein
MSENVSYLDASGEWERIYGVTDPPGRTAENETALAIQQSVEQLGSYLSQMGQIMIRMQARLDELEEKQRMVTLSHDEVKAVQILIRNRSMEYCEKYDLRDAGSRRAISGAIKKAVLNRYGVKDLHDVPAIARQAVESQISRWADIRLAMKCREKSRAGCGGA